MPPGMAQSLGPDVPFTMLSGSEVFSLSVRLPLAVVSDYYPFVSSHPAGMTRFAPLEITR